MHLGLVSNCWRTQLQAGDDLLDGITAASARGYRWIELRQTCMGRFETGDPPQPDAAPLDELPQRFPELRFNIAVNVPFLEAAGLDGNPVVQAGIAAANAVAGSHPPHLRLVDLSTREPGSDVAAITRGIATLAGTLRDQGGILSVEQSIQPWDAFRNIIDAVRQLLGDDRDRVQLCYDPVNLLNGDPHADPVAITRSLDAAAISMVHLKQRRDGRVLPRVEDGDVDWRGVLAALTEIAYRGPYLYEIAPGDNVWNEIDTSAAYLDVYPEGAQTGFHRGG